MSTIFDDLCLVTKTKPKPGEAFEDFAQRVYDKAQKLPDKPIPGDDSKPHWEMLSEAAQNWVNDCVPVFDQRSALRKEGKLDEAAALAVPEMEGFEAVVGGTEAAPTEGVEASSKAKPSPKAQGEAGKAPAGKKAAANPRAQTKASSGAKKAKANGPGRGRKRKFKPEQKVKFLVAENPHRKGTKRWHIWAKYRDGMTVEEAYKRGVTSRNLMFSQADGQIKVT